MHDDVFNLYVSDDETPLVVDVPHSGREFPSDFKTRLDALTLRRWEDCYVDELMGDAPQHGADLLVMRIPRTYVDLNRHVLDVDPNLIRGEISLPFQPEAKTVELGRGLIKRIGPNGQNIHDTPLDEDDVLHRIESYYIPYHLTLEERLFHKKGTSRKAVYHLNMHAMYSVDAASGTNRADFVLSDNHGKTSDNAFTLMLKETLEDMGYSVAVNDPFLGGEIVRMYGKPNQGFHSVQIEIKKSLYMDEDTFEKHKGFNKLKKDMAKLLAAAARFARN